MSSMPLPSIAVAAVGVSDEWLSHCGRRVVEHRSRELTSRTRDVAILPSLSSSDNGHRSREHCPRMISRTGGMRLC